MVFSFARISAVLGMKVEDYYPNGKRWWLRLHEKGGKFHEVPAHHNAEAYLDAYIEAAGIAGDREGAALPLGPGQDPARSPSQPLRRNNALAMVKRRAVAAGLSDAGLLPHLPGHRHHRLPRGRRDHREGPANRRPREPEDDQALRPHQRPDYARRNRADCDLTAARPSVPPAGGWGRRPWLSSLTVLRPWPPRDAEASEPDSPTDSALLHGDEPVTAPTRPLRTSAKPWLRGS